MGLVPPHRETQGGFVDLSVRHNLTISSLGRWRGRTRLLAARRECEDAETVAETLGIVPDGVETPFGLLSGGNKQKVVFGRALLRKPGLFVLCEPTRGVDVETRTSIYRLIHALRDDGAAVLIVSSDSEDLFATCDRVGAVEDGVLGPLRPVHLMNSADMEALL
ncbi:ATP-binding cassette domain-containing protein [Aeromicrobium sp. UC242_57]|uniref:ATP-binding cassette domain-containing protein n=1 Tax=Aeromicrobium sp. UC242_57 TaxID=3374624 RepID=UPI0037ADFEB2